MNRFAVAALTVTLAACAGTRAERGTAQPDVETKAGSGPTSRAGDHGGMAAMCPMDVPGTSVTSADTAEGEALTFMTTSGQVDELRRRVRAMADMHNRHMSAAAAPDRPAAGSGTGAGEGSGHGHDHGHGMMPPPSRASVEDVENGARVSIAPLDPANADQLRTMARMHAMHMQQNGCGMMHGGEPHR